MASYSQVLAEAQRLRRCNLACTGISLFMTSAGKKHLVPKPRWQKTTHGNCLTEVVSEGDNALMLNTGDHSDIVALDLDVPKSDDVAAGRLDGLAIMQELFKKHGFHKSTPIQITGSGGQHVLFSLSKRLEHGLLSAKNATKVKIGGTETTIDIRGDSGGLIVFPSRYQTQDGVMKSYEWQTPPGNKDELQAMPPWLITFINEGTKRTRSGDNLMAPAKRPRGTEASTDAYYALTRNVLQKVVGDVEKTWPREGGYDFAPTDRH